MVFLGMKYVLTDPSLGLANPNKIWLSKYLDDHGIAHTGSDHRAVGLECNKELAKQRLADVGLNTARFTVVRIGDNLLERDMLLTYPLFVKPTNRGGGAGIDAGSLVYTFAQLRSKVKSLAARLQCDVLVEEYLPGREFSVGILKRLHTNMYHAMPIELVAPLNVSGARFLSSQIKSADTERNLAVVEPALRTALNDLALDAFHALGARDYGRIDIRLDATGVPHFLEANLLPSLLCDYGNFPKTCMLNIGLGHTDMIMNIIDLAFSRTAIKADLFRRPIVRRSALLPTRPAGDYVVTG